MKTHRVLREDAPIRERGDLPVWLVVLIMTMGVAALVWGVAQKQIKDALALVFG